MKELKKIWSLNCVFNIVILTTIPINSQNFLFDQHPIDLSFPGIHAIKVLDLDDDGDIDIVAGSEITPVSNSIGLHWLRNDGGDPIIWTRFEIDDSFEHVMSVDVDYIDGDSHPDVVSSSWSLHQIAWWKNSGDPTQPWVKYIVTTNFINPHDAKCDDIDNDGDVDIVTVNSTPGSIMIFYNDGGSPIINWQSEYLANSFLGGKRVSILDLDKDNDLDVLGTASQANEVAWWSNLGGNPLTWSKSVISSDFQGSADLFVVDIDYDEIYDIIANASSSNQVAYWICDDLQNNFWTNFTVTTELEIAASVSGGDIDKDNDIDIIAVGKIPGELVIYENNNFTWSKTVLATNFYGGTALAVVDFDNDCDLDIISGASGLGELYWWENKIVTSVNSSSSNNWHFVLNQNYPNPFNPSTTIEFSLPEATYVTLAIYNTLGQKITELVNSKLETGRYSCQWNAGNAASGMYIFELKTDKFVSFKKMVLVK